MSYLVLARKYRSRTFLELVGQEHVVKALTNALTQGRLHHAYLFTGTRGVGKTSVSRILAKSLNCVGPDGQGGVTAQPCGVCHACRDIDAGRFVDYIELDAASNRGVDEITTLLDQAVYKPVVGRFKVYMIDEVHMLSNTAFNAMLKTLEEPPDYLKFVLATTDPQKVPPTVLSRCLQFNLRPMAPQTVQQHLAQVLGDEHIEADAGSLRLLSRAARGSMRDALSLTDQAIAYGAGSLTETGVREMLGAVDRGHAVRIVEALAAVDGAGLVGAADALRGLGLSAVGTLDELAGLLQQMAVTQAVPDSLDESDPESPTVRRLSALLAADELQLLYSMALHGRADIGLAPDEYSGLVMVLLRMLAFRPVDVVRTLPPRAEAAGSSGASSSVEAGASTAVTTATNATASNESVQAGGAASASVDPVANIGDMSGPTTVLPAATVSVPAPREAALRTSTSPVASLRVVTDLGPSSTTRPMAVPGGPSDPARSGGTMARKVSTTAASDEADDFGEPPPWVDVPFESDDDVAVMQSPVRSVPLAAPSIERSRSLDVESSSSPAPSSRTGFDEPIVLVGAASSDVAVAVAVTVATDAPLAITPLPTTPHGDRWAEVVDRMTRAGSIGALVRELALQAECVQSVEPGATGAWRLRVERESLRAPGLVEKLRTALATLLGAAVELDVERGTAADSPALRNAAERERRQREAERLIHDDPLVKQLLARYRSARIVPGSIKPV